MLNDLGFRILDICKCLFSKVCIGKIVPWPSSSELCSVIVWCLGWSNAFSMWFSTLINAKYCFQYSRVTSQVIRHRVKFHSFCRALVAPFHSVSASNVWWFRILDIEFFTEPPLWHYHSTASEGNMNCRPYPAPSCFAHHPPHCFCQDHHADSIHIVFALSQHANAPLQHSSHCSTVSHTTSHTVRSRAATHFPGSFFLPNNAALQHAAWCRAQSGVEPFPAFPSQHHAEVTSI